MRHRALVLTLLIMVGLPALVLLLAACDPFALPTAPTPTPTPIPTATEVPQPTDTPEPTMPPAVEASPTAPGISITPTASEAELQREVEDIETDTSQVRGLKPKQDVREHFISQQQLRDNLVKEIGEDYSHEEARQDATALWLLRLIKDPSIDLYQLQVDLLSEQVLGYYDHKKKELFVLSSQSQLSPLERMTLSHEFTHALQDQYYDLGKLRPDKIENDKGTAVLSLIEGDAVASSIVYAQQHMSDEDLQRIVTESGNLSSKVLDRAPRYIRESLTFPYDQGLTFVTQIARAGSFGGVDKALADPPQSTEQILHPEKYLDKPRDNPVPVTPPPLTTTLGAGWTMSDTDTLGEFDLEEMLKDNDIEEDTATQAAEGWGGASYALYQKGDAALVIMDTKWDTTNDAAEFNDAMQQTFGSLKKDGSLWSDGKRFFGLMRSGDRVTYAGGTDRAAVQRALGAIKP